MHAIYSMQQSWDLGTTARHQDMVDQAVVCHLLMALPHATHVGGKDQGLLGQTMAVAIM